MTKSLFISVIVHITRYVSMQALRRFLFDICVIVKIDNLFIHLIALFKLIFHITRRGKCFSHLFF